MSDKDDSIFKRYYRSEPFIDRFLSGAIDAVDVIIPVIHTNELWEANLRSLYREIPINRLLIGDGGCIDDTVSIAKKFPRVVVYDHRQYKSLGYSIRKLIEEVETEWFIYPHSDVYLPEGWFDTMKKYQDSYDWYGCRMCQTALIEYDGDFEERPWAGAQMAKKKAFEKGLAKIDDDYVYRQEDYVWRKLIQDGGFKEGFVSDTFHYHQLMYKPTPWGRKIAEVKLKLVMSREEEVRMYDTQVRGLVKYLLPDSDWKIQTMDGGLFRLLELKELNWREFRAWVKATNPAWLPYVSRRRFIRRYIISFIRVIDRMFFK